MKKLSVLAVIIGMTFILGACQGAETGGESNNGDKIAVISREEGSGTRNAFEEILEINTDTDNAMRLDVIIRDGNGVVATHVATNPASIGYVSFATLEANANQLRGLSVDGVEPTAENVLNGTYTIARPFNMVYNEEHLTDLDRAFIDFITSVQGLQILESADTIVDFDGAQEFDASQYGNLTGTLTLGGSTSTERAITAVAEIFAAKFPQVIFTYNSSGSGSGIRNAQSGTYSLGFASRELLDSELESGLQSKTICKDGIVLVVHIENEITNITTEQIRELYLGGINYWSELN